MPDAAPDLVKLEDITSEFDDLNGHDTIYRTAYGYVVKVKTVEIPHQCGATCYRATASLCDPDTSKAHRIGGRPFVLHWHHDALIYPWCSLPEDILARINEARAIVVGYAEMAALHHHQRQRIPGVKLLPIGVPDLTPPRIPPPATPVPNWSAAAAASWPATA